MGRLRVPLVYNRTYFYNPVSFCNDKQKVEKYSEEYSVENSSTIVNKIASPAASKTGNELEHKNAISLFAYKYRQRLNSWTTDFLFTKSKFK